MRSDQGKRCDGGFGFAETLKKLIFFKKKKTKGLGFGLGWVVGCCVGWLGRVLGWVRRWVVGLRGWVVAWFGVVCLCVVCWAGCWVGCWVLCSLLSFEFFQFLSFFVFFSFLIFFEKNVSSLSFCFCEKNF